MTPKGILKNPEETGIGNNWSPSPIPPLSITADAKKRKRGEGEGGWAQNTRLCQYWIGKQKKSCKRGKKCKFAHPADGENLWKRALKEARKELKGQGKSGNKKKKKKKNKLKQGKKDSSGSEDD